MTDQEMTRVCAEAMGYHPTRVGYAPLFNNAQAFALIKKWNIGVQPFHDGWLAWGYAENMHYITERYEDLNRAIVVCAVRLILDERGDAAHGETSKEK